MQQGDQVRVNFIINAWKYYVGTANIVNRKRTYTDTEAQINDEERFCHLSKLLMKLKELQEMSVSLNNTHERGMSNS